MVTELRVIDAQVLTAMFGPLPTTAPTAGALVYVIPVSVQLLDVVETTQPSAEVAKLYTCRVAPVIVPVTPVTLNFR